MGGNQTFLLHHRCEKLVVEPLFLRVFHICKIWWRKISKWSSGWNSINVRNSNLHYCINKYMLYLFFFTLFLFYLIFLQRFLIPKGWSVLYSICEIHETDPIYHFLTALREQTRMFQFHPIWRWNKEWPRSSWTVLMLNCSPAQNGNWLPRQSQTCSTCRSPANSHPLALQITFIIHIFRPV